MTSPDLPLLAAFCYARLDEDEAAALAASGDEATIGDTWHEDDPVRRAGLIRDQHGGVVVYDEGSPVREQAVHIARHDPARTLREVEVKRMLTRFALVNAEVIDGEWGDCHGADEIAAGKCGDYGARAAGDVLLMLAAVWSDHPDYRAEWAS